MARLAQIDQGVQVPIGQWAPLMTWAEIGTLCRVSGRRCAVTTISSQLGVVGGGVGGLGRPYGAPIVGGDRGRERSRWRRMRVKERSRRGKRRIRQKPPYVLEPLYPNRVRESRARSESIVISINNIDAIINYDSVRSADRRREAPYQGVNRREGLGGCLPFWVPRRA